MFDIWNSPHPLAEEAYKKDNYKITLHPEVKNGECVLYFSSNEVWFPNTEGTFHSAILEKDRYEWEAKPYRVGEKNIYIRDIYKSWYVQGVSERLGSIDAVLAWLKEETAGYEVVCIGSSAGGYMATVAGIYLHAKIVYAFSPQYCLYHPAYYDKNPFLQKYKDDANREKYYDISPMVNKSDIPIVYIYPDACAEDIFQADKIKKRENLIKWGLHNKHHGIVVYKCNLERLLNMDFADIQELTDEGSKNPFFLSCRISGIGETVKCVSDTLKRVAMKKIKR